MSEDVWSEEDTTPDAIEAALRDLLRRRHADNPELIPARVLNLVVVADQEWKGEIQNRLEKAGRYRASRTILCAVEDGRDTLDAVMVMSYDEAPGGTLGVIHEKVEIDVGPEHLQRLDTIVDPVLAAELPTMVWSPHGFTEAVQALLPMTDVVLLDSDEHDPDGATLARAAELLDDVYVVDLAWLRTTPWRERLAASFDTSDRRPALACLEEVRVRHHPASRPSATLLAGWLAARLDWSPEKLSHEDDTLSGDLKARKDRHVRVVLEPFDQEAPGLAGVTVSWDGCSISLDRGPGGLCAQEVLSGGRELSWRVLGASRGEGGILGEGVRQALLRDPTYALGAAHGSGALPVSARLEIVHDPARAASALLLSAVLAGGHVVLTGGSTPRQAYTELATAVRELGITMERTVFWFGDERCVPPDDEKSNYRMAKEALFDQLGGGAACEVKRIRGELGPFPGADAYEQELQTAGSPRFDLVLMGLGPDGHTASLFPDQPTRAGALRAWSSGYRKRDMSPSSPA